MRTLRMGNRVELPDVNILLALLDPAHIHHPVATKWFQGVDSWATCSLTENGCIRVLSSPAYSGVDFNCEDVIELLTTLCSNHSTSHHYWVDSPSLRDHNLINPARVKGPKQISDISLLALCQQEGGTLVTMDRSIQLSAIVSPHPLLLKILHC